ncbi:hypothetical protein K501DRAFT_336306 [Backusella circina FSU 941]|nr:hypothetical protein K501DRAFT_336306 [Backusella circina FSU 941]
MIDKLPAEIVLTISIYLQFKDKLNLAITCSRLHDLITGCALYEELNLMKYGKNPHKIIDMFDNNPFDGSQVKTLSIKMHQIPEQLRSRLSTVFPNLSRVIIGKSGEHTARLISRTGDTPPMSRWINTLQIYDMYHDWIEIFHSLRSNIFPHLSELKVGLMYSYSERRIGFNPLYFAPIIKNAPYLTKLVLYDCDINLELLEQVHNGCPHIKTLRLEYVTLVIDTPLPQNIDPAIGVLKLELYNTACFDRSGVFIDYILRKYTNINYFVLDLDRQEYAIDSKLSQYFPNFFDNSDSEHDFNSGSDEVISRLRQDFRTGISVYLDSGATFFSSLPKSIKTLKMDIKSFHSIIEVLGNAHMNLTELDFCDPSLYRNILMNPNQLRHLYKLPSLRTLKIPINSSVQRYKGYSVSSTLTRLVIECQNGPLYIDWLFSIFPSIQHLFIKHSKCNIGGLSDYSAFVHEKYPNLKSLGFRKCTIYPGLLPYVKAAAPNMTTLKLDSVAIITVSKEKTYNIDISGCNLKKFCISLHPNGFYKKLRFYNKFTIQGNDKEPIHVSLGDSLSVTQCSDSLGEIKYTTAIKDIHQEVMDLQISDS